MRHVLRGGRPPTGAHPDVYEGWEVYVKATASAPIPPRGWHTMNTVAPNSLPERYRNAAQTVQRAGCAYFRPAVDDTHTAPSGTVSRETSFRRSGTPHTGTTDTYKKASRRHAAEASERSAGRVSRRTRQLGSGVAGRREARIEASCARSIPFWSVLSETSSSAGRLFTRNVIGWEGCGS